MLKILIPVDGRSNSLHAVTHAAHEFRKNSALEIHLLNVQAPLSNYIARFVSKEERDAFRRDQAELALLPARQMLNSLAVPYEAHVKLGEKASGIADLAWRPGCNVTVFRPGSVRLWRRCFSPPVVECRRPEYGPVTDRLRTGDILK